MTSEIRTNLITSRAGLSTVTFTDSGPMFSGITTFVDNSGFTFGVGAGSSIFTPATNTLTLGTNNSERLRIASDGDLTLTGADNVEMKMRCGTSSGNNILAFLNSGGTTRGNITYDSDHNFLLFNVNQGEKLRITSDGVLKLTGQTTVRETAGLTYHTNGNLYIRGGTTGAIIQSVDENEALVVQNTYITAVTAGAERLRIDSTGRLLLGTTTEGSAGADEFTINTASGHGGMTIRNDTSSNGNIWFSDGTSGAAEYAGYVQYAHNGDHMVFGAGGAERLRITSGGNVAINKTSSISAKLHIGDTGNNAALSQLIKLGNDSSNAGTGSQINLGAGNGVESTSACIGGFYDGTGTAFIVKTAGTYANQSTVLERLRIGSDGLLTLKNNSGMMIDLQSSAGTGSAWIEFSDTDGTRKGYLGYGSGSSEKVYWVQQKAANMSMYSNGNDRFEVQSNGIKVVKNGRLNINSTFIDFSGDVSVPQTAAAIYRPADNTLAFSTANSERLRIDSSGNMRWYPDGASGVNFYMSSNGASGIIFAANKDGANGTSLHFKNQNSSGTAQTWMEVNDSQRISIPYGMGGTDKLNIYVAADVTKGINIIGQDGNNQNSDSGRIHFNGYAQTNGPWIGGDNVQSWGKKALVFGTVSTTNDYSTEVSETMRLTQFGDVQIGISPNNTLWDSSNNEQGMYYRRAEGSFAMATRSSTGYSNWYMNKNTTGGNSDNRYIDFYWNSTTKGSITNSGGSSTSYNTSSDYRLKENIVDITDGITRLKQLKPRRFNWIEDSTNTIQDGFIAHEVSSFIPEAVTGTKDRVVTQAEVDADTQPQNDAAGTPVYQQMDYAKVTPLLTAALQEAIAKIETLEQDNIALRTRVTNLEGN